MVISGGLRRGPTTPHFPWTRAAELAAEPATALASDSAAAAAISLRWRIARAGNKRLHLQLGPVQPLIGTQFRGFPTISIGTASHLRHSQKNCPIPKFCLLTCKNRSSNLPDDDSERRTEPGQRGRARGNPAAAPERVYGTGENHSIQNAFVVETRTQCNFNALLVRLESNFANGFPEFTANYRWTRV